MNYTEWLTNSTEEERQAFMSAKNLFLNIQLPMIKKINELGKKLYSRFGCYIAPCAYSYDEIMLDYCESNDDIYNILSGHGELDGFVLRFYAHVEFDCEAYDNESFCGKILTEEEKEHLHAFVVNILGDDFFDDYYYRVERNYNIDEIYNVLNNLYNQLCDYTDSHKAYKWVASSNDGAFDDESKGAFDTREECYNDMRNAALEKMKWNTNEEDFDGEDNVIPYRVEFYPNKIVHNSYSGEYTYKIVEAEMTVKEHFDVDFSLTANSIACIDEASNKFKTALIEFIHSYIRTNNYGKNESECFIRAENAK